MLLSETARRRARILCAIGAGLAIFVASLAWFGFDDGSWTLVVPVVVTIVAAIWPTRLVVAGAMLITSAVVIVGMEDSGVLFGASAVALMLALNNLQSAATKVRPGFRRTQRAHA